MTSGHTIEYSATDGESTEKSEPKLKRFALFAGNFHYPNGGWSDFIVSFDSKEAADACIQVMPRERYYDLCAYPSTIWAWEWVQVVDLHTGRVVSNFLSSKVVPDEKRNDHVMVVVGNGEWLKK